MRKVKEKNDKYYLTKYQMTEDQLADYKKKLADIGDPDLIVEDLIEPEISLRLSKSAKIAYLTKLRSKVLTILYLIEQQKDNPEINPDSYMVSLIMDIRGANMLFDDMLTEICVKVCGIYASHNESEFGIIRKQVLETRRLVDDLLAEIKKSEKE